MINSTNIAEQTVATNGNILFANTQVRTCSANCCNGWLNHNAGSGIFQIIKPGIYEIQFNTNVSSATAGVINLAISSNGEILQGSQMNTTNVANNVYNVSSNRLIRVCGNGSTTLSVSNVGANDITITNPNIIIKKVA